MSKRRKARETALQVLYAWNIAGESFDEVASKIMTGTHLDEHAMEFTHAIIKIVTDRFESLDLMIKEQLENWDLNRVATLDRNILRIALAEILYFDDIPSKVSIDEAIELAKKYSTENSGKFINGILDAIAFKKERT
ncbi:MAG: transcription antitermination factor NusB [bacterium]